MRASRSADIDPAGVWPASSSIVGYVGGVHERVFVAVWLPQRVSTQCLNDGNRATAYRRGWRAAASVSMQRHEAAADPAEPISIARR